VKLGALRGTPVSLVPRTVSIGPNPRIFGNCLAWIFGNPRASYCVLRFTLQGLNQSIAGLSPLSETA
jgi:hypothetical protein